MTYFRKRWEETLRVLGIINEAGFLHNDIMKNVMVECTPAAAGAAEETATERVLWLDFDRAETVEEGKVTDRRFGEEMELAVNIGRDRVSRVLLLSTVAPMMCSNAHMCAGEGSGGRIRSMVSASREAIRASQQKWRYQQVQPRRRSMRLM